ncbi:hypothetical protein Q5P01_024400 [Channa striata]|uniref:Uncharacterized protein n=1 Tax=Channa striata TaxID=64152 RepID=A0AA88ITN1_CHASR|nr:hypothetical protein Q5P01_024400 [Channa striata]
MRNSITRLHLFRTSRTGPTGLSEAQQVKAARGRKGGEPPPLEPFTSRKRRETWCGGGGDEAPGRRATAGFPVFIIPLRRTRETPKVQR